MVQRVCGAESLRAPGVWARVSRRQGEGGSAVGAERRGPKRDSHERLHVMLLRSMIGEGEERKREREKERERQREREITHVEEHGDDDVDENERGAEHV